MLDYLNSASEYNVIYNVQKVIWPQNTDVILFTTEPNKGRLKILRVSYMCLSNPNGVSANPLIRMGTPAGNTSIHSDQTLAFNSNTPLYFHNVAAAAAHNLAPNTNVICRNGAASGAGVLLNINVIGFYTL